MRAPATTRTSMRASSRPTSSAARVARVDGGGASRSGCGSLLTRRSGSRNGDVGSGGAITALPARALDSRPVGDGTARKLHIERVVGRELSRQRGRQRLDARAAAGVVMETGQGL